jgi:hypothetical protein
VIEKIGGIKGTMENQAVDLPKAEISNQKETVKKHPKEFDLIEVTKSQFIYGFNLFGRYKFKSEAEESQLLVITRSFHSFRCAVELMKKAYYVQAIAIIRMMTEDFFICGNLEIDDEISQVLLGRIKKNFNFHDMAIKMKANEAYETYKLQCEFTHCRPESIGTLIELVDEKNLQLKLVPIYDETLFVMCCEMRLKDSLRMLVYLNKIIGGFHIEKGIDWSAKLNSLLESFNLWMKELKQSDLANRDKYEGNR